MRRLQIVERLAAPEFSSCFLRLEIATATNVLALLASKHCSATVSTPDALKHNVQLK